jgi:hypothetical protein
MRLQRRLRLSFPANLLRFSAIRSTRGEQFLPQAQMGERHEQAHAAALAA